MGAGSYAMNGAGGAAATGNGDVMMRFLPSYVFLNNLIMVVSSYLVVSPYLIGLTKFIYFVLHKLPTSQCNAPGKRNNYRI